jgi:hypothetical protein
MEQLMESKGLAIDSLYKQFLKNYWIIFILCICACTKTNDRILTVVKGDDFEIEFTINPAIGLENCYFRSKKNKVELLNKNLKEIEINCDGCPSKEIWKFKAISEGIDTLKFELCPTARESKSCENYFDLDSTDNYIIEVVSKR